MPNGRAERVAELFKSAVECGRERWSAFLDEECPSDPALRAEIESLLQEQDGASRFLEVPALHLAAESLARGGAFHAGQTIGTYEIVSLIGSGGMGEVYLAQDRELHRKVALKLVRRGMASVDMIHYFKREEHLLASLNHPNIAQLYGGGMTADGIPFFAMEYVEGERLDQYCDGRGLATEERLQLFRKVCSAVTYAHQHLVIHRDLKPANIRVTPEGEPKLLDFGIAKLLKSEDAQSSGQTLTLQGVMTPEYASPEQVAGGSITTASDVYSLGVVLYKLLTGQSPYRTKTTRPDEIARAITDQEPVRPSTTALHFPQDPQFATRNPKFLKGDLDNIALMALRKDPARRYQSVGQFSADIQRHLDGLPVIARKDTFKYRTAKFVGRNKIGVAAVILLTMTLFAGIIATSVQARRAELQRTRAEKRFNDVRTLAHSLLFEILPKFASSPGTNEAREVLVKRALEYLDSLAQEGGNDPALQRELAVAYRALGEQIEAARGDRAEVLNSYRKALALDEALVRANPDNAEARDELAREFERIGWSLWLGRNTQEALIFYQKALVMREPLMANNPQSFDFRYRLAHLKMAIGDLLNGDNDTKEALRNYRQAMALMTPLNKGGSSNLRLQRAIIYCHNGMGEVLWRDNDLTGALQEYDQALAILEPIYTSSPDDLTSLDLLGSVYSGRAQAYRKQNDYKSALALLGKCVQMWEATLKKGDAYLRRPLATAYSDLGEVLCDTTDFRGAIEYLQRAIAIQEEVLTGGVKNRDYTASLALSYERLAAAQRKLDNPGAAVHSYNRALYLRGENAVDAKNAGVQNELALCCSDMGLLHIDMASTNDATAQDRLVHWREARSHYERSREILQRLREEYPERGSFKSKLDEVSVQLNRCDQALARL